jgi:hypothetical protein
MATIDESAGNLDLATVVIDVQGMNRAMGFWPAVGYVRRERDWDPEFMMLVDPSRRETSADRCSPAAAPGCA